MARLRGYFLLSSIFTAALFALACSAQSQAGSAKLEDRELGSSAEQSAGSQTNNPAQSLNPKLDQSSQRARFSPSINIAKFYDVRPKEISTLADDKRQYSQPKGRVEDLVTKALTQAFEKKGIAISTESKQLLRGEFAIGTLRKGPGATI